MFQSCEKQAFKYRTLTNVDVGVAAVACTLGLSGFKDVKEKELI